MSTREVPMYLNETGLAPKMALVASGEIDENLRDLVAGVEELGAGYYTFTTDQIPDAFTGSIVCYLGTLGAASNFNGVTVLGMDALGPVIDQDQLDAIEQKTALISAGSVTVLSPVARTGGTITARVGDTWAITLEGLGDLSAIDELWFAIKFRTNATDEEAVIFASESVGAIRANNSCDPIEVQADWASITVDDEAAGDVTVTISKLLTTDLEAMTAGRWALKALEGSKTRTVTSGTMVIVGAEIDALE